MQLPDGRVRKKRRSIEVPNHAHELTCSCYRRLKLLNHDRTRLWLVQALDEARRSLDFEIWAYVIMPDHVHALIWPRADAYSMPRFLQAIKQPVAQRAIAHLQRESPSHLVKLRNSGNDAHHFWQPGGGYDRNLITIEACWKSIHHIHDNPVRACLVAEPTQWTWSSARWYAGERDVPLLMDRRPWEQTTNGDSSDNP